MASPCTGDTRGLRMKPKSRLKFLPLPGFEPRTSQSNDRERHHSATAHPRGESSSVGIPLLRQIKFAKPVYLVGFDAGSELSAGQSSGVARQFCARGRAMKLAPLCPPAPSLFFQISKLSFEILKFKF